MREPSERVLRLACVALAALLLIQLARIVARRNPVAHLEIPALPTLAEAGKSGDHMGGAPAQMASAGTATYPEASHPGASTNNAAGPPASKGDTNASSLKSASGKAGTNVPVATTGPKPLSVEPSASGKAEHADAEHSTNLEAQGHSPVLAPGKLASHASSNGVPDTTGSNAIHSALSKSLTNSISQTSHGPPPGMLPGMPGGPRGPGMRPGMPGNPPTVPPEILARVDRVIDSEILGPVMHPLPMALLGIAGNSAFLRAPSGQTGLVKEGDKLGELKLLQIGINRVLVEEDGQKKELMIFSGLGGESLLPNEHKTSP